MNQILVNFLDNALKFTENGSIEFGFEEQDKTIRFFVRDTGVGISEENMNKIFDRFTKIEEDRKKLFPGAGLGLTIAKRLVELLNGEIWVESEVGVGSVFYFQIPSEIKHTKHQTEKVSPDLLEFDWSGKKYWWLKMKFPILRY